MHINQNIALLGISYQLWFLGSALVLGEFPFMTSNGDWKVYKYQKLADKQYVDVEYYNHYLDVVYEMWASCWDWLVATADLARDEVIVSERAIFSED